MSQIEKDILVFLKRNPNSRLREIWKGVGYTLYEISHTVGNLEYTETVRRVSQEQGFAFCVND